jgi:3-hydroxyisobutyrate dehydrogenase-like beta-hydroxyacid dehydrogenase
VETTNYGFVGIGRMGAHMAHRLLKAGFSVTVFDTSADAVEDLVSKGAQPAKSAAEVASASETVLLSLPTPEIVEAATLGAKGVSEGTRVKQVFDCSTTGPAGARVVSAALAKKSIAYLDCPVSGGIAGARNGTLAIMVSGDRKIYEQHEKALKELGKLFFVGDRPGQGQIMKLANNLLAAAALVLTSEAMVMGVKAGLDPAQMLDVINSGSGRNSATQDKFPRAVLTRGFDFGFATGLSYKDVRLCLAEADNLGVPMPAGAVVMQMLAITKARFGADSDFTSIARVVEEWAGVEIKG